MSQDALAVRSRGVVHAGARHRVPRTVVVLALLDGFVGLTAAIGAAIDISVGRFGRQYGFGAPPGASGGGTVGHELWPQVLARVAATVAASSP